MEALIWMLIICWVPQGGQLVEVWRIEKRVTAEHCLIMSHVVAGGGKAAAITVRCIRN